MMPGRTHMMFSRKMLCLYFILIGFQISCVTNKTEENPDENVVASPDGNLRVAFALQENGQPAYSIFYRDSLVLTDSKLGLSRTDSDFSKGMTLASVSEPQLVRDEYVMMHGKRRLCTYQANEKSFSLSNTAGEKLNIIFRVSDDGVAFRYHFPDKSADPKKIDEELTSFHFREGTKAFLQPMSVAKTGFEGTNPSYEEHYQQNIPADQPAPTEAGWVYPALFNYGDTWLLITEANLDRNYCATRLKQHSPGNEYAVGFPMAAEVMPGGALNPESELPWYSPWRIITIGSLGTIVESTLGTDLAAPAIKEDFSFVEPGVASWSWVILKDNSINYEVQKQFVDYAANMGWEYCLIDVNWDTTIGYDRIEELSRYAASKNVGLVLWYNSAGSWNTVQYHPKDKLLTPESRKEEFSRLQKMGIRGIKVDFFGGDGQSVIAYYHDIFKDAAAYGIMVNCHGSTLPRGWHRTYPNLLTMEAIKGMEFITFEQANADLAPSHSAMLPFSRNAFDPMDFTPMVLHEIPGIERKTTNGFELALPYLFLSGIQHIAETPAGMEQVPDYVKEFVKDIPVAWDDTRFVDGYPGKLAVIARKKGDTWYVSGINGEAQAKTLNLDLSFIGRGKEGVLITDGEEPKSFSKTNVSVPASAYQLNVEPNGGFVMKF
ncbi:glycoside hydrolase family 97 protein [Cesiribacter sp. SM1]|uniref:glycoside hydrolase family 97 protein n=1 Tax=Cesiribacter sp. SM1 TaxID=2861196 RepID=UPI001CD2B025|nr:glycoside hydrolase family 97 protein [Cesiribacter sp. SM1]